MKFIIGSIFSIFVAVSYSLAQTERGIERLVKELDRLDATENMQPASWSFCLKSLKTGEVVVEKNSLKALVPASTMKIILTATALELLGADYTFKTVLEYDGIIDENQVLQGNLYIKGSGDPTLGAGRIKENPDYLMLMAIWANQIQAAGIKSINGNIIADESVFVPQTVSGEWQWKDLGNYYGAAAQGININENIYRIYFKGGKQGSNAAISRIEPNLEDVRHTSLVTFGAVGSGDNAFVYAAPYQNERFVAGTIPASANGFYIKGAIPDPARFAAQQLQQALQKLNITISGSVTTSTTMLRAGQKMATKRTTIYTHNSPPLSAIVKEINHNSLNLYAEAVTKLLGFQLLSEGSSEGGVKAMENHWKLKGLNMHGVIWHDGCGLAPTNAISAARMTDILYYAANSNYFNDFYNSLPIVGVSGTVKSMCQGTAAAGNIRVKSGTLTRVICYSGYVKMKNGEQLAFSMMTNRYAGDYYTMRRNFEKLMTLMAEM
jgi:D-alanyl-D-alanine carboxypeptidase/D-alanyl-D-alanine-endopeptidase (penicillin-binding protein 4)